MPKSSRAKARGPRPTSRTVKAGEFKATCLKLMDEVRDRGIEIVVTKRGRPVAKLGPIDPDAGESPSGWGFMRGTVLWQGDIVSPDFEAWEESETDPLNSE